MLSSCAINSLNDEKTVITLGEESGDQTILISLTRGPEWASKMTPGPFIIHVYPQVVFWTETLNGEFMETLYITGADGDYPNHATKKRLDDEFFRQCLPVWTGRLIRAGGTLPSTEEPYPDAITSATPQSSFDLNIPMKKRPESFRLFAEINKSGDYNEQFTEDSSDWIGQPSLVYAAEITTAEPGVIYRLKPIGHGNIGPEISTLHHGFNGIDTALDLVGEITVTIHDNRKIQGN